MTDNTEQNNEQPANKQTQTQESTHANKEETTGQAGEPQTGAKSAEKSLMKQPLAIALAIIAVVIIILVVSQQDDESTVAKSSAGPGVGAEEITLSPPSLDSAGNSTPNIVENMNRKSGSVSAPGLDALVKGLEEKVASDPANMGNRILLAQTYNELGMQDKALTEMRALQKEQPDNGRVNLVLGSILSRSNDQEKVKESMGFLEKAGNDASIQGYLVDMYKGDALIRMQDHEGALKHWKLALDNMPASDNRRATLEQRISNLSTKEGAAQKEDNKT